MIVSLSVHCNDRATSLSIDICSPINNVQHDRMSSYDDGTTYDDIATYVDISTYIDISTSIDVDVAT